MPKTAQPTDQWDARRDGAVPSPVQLGEPLLTPQEAASLLRLPASTVYDLARRDALPHIRIGRAIRFSRADLEEFLGAQRRVA